MPSLVQCSSCGRHVRASESACPFCDALVLASEPGAVPGVRVRRAALIAATLTVAACAPTTDKPAPEPAPVVSATPTSTAASMAITATAPMASDSVTTPTVSAPSASAAPVASARLKLGGGPVTPRLVPEWMSVGARYGLPPFLADDDYV